MTPSRETSIPGVGPKGTQKSCLWAPYALTHSSPTGGGRVLSSLFSRWTCSQLPAPSSLEVIRQCPAFKHTSTTCLSGPAFGPGQRSLLKDWHSPWTPGGLRPPVLLHLFPSSPVSAALSVGGGWLGWAHRTPFSAFLRLLVSFRNTELRERSHSVPRGNPNPSAYRDRWPARRLRRGVGRPWPTANLAGR